MGRYSPTVRPDPGGPLDFSGLSRALQGLQQRRVQKAQMERDDARYADQQGRLDREEAAQTETRENAVRAAGGTAMDEMDLGTPGVRTTPAFAPERLTTRVPDALGGGMIASPDVPRETSSPAAWRGTYTQTVNGRAFLVDPSVPLRRQAMAEDAAGAPARTSSGRVIRTLLGTTPSYAGTLGKLSDDDLGRLPLSSVDEMIRAGQVQPAKDLAGRGRALGIDVSGMSPGEAETRLGMAEKQWENAHRPPPQIDPYTAEARVTLQEDRQRRSRADFADRMVEAYGGQVPNDNKNWRPADLAEAKRLGMTWSDYRAAMTRYTDNPSRAAVRAERAEQNADPVKRVIENTLRQAGGAKAQPPAANGPRATSTGAVVANDYTDADFERALRAIGTNATEAQARAWLKNNPRR